MQEFLIDERAEVSLITIDSLTNSLTLFALIVAAHESVGEIEITSPTAAGFVRKKRETGGVIIKESACPGAPARSFPQESRFPVPSNV